MLDALHKVFSSSGSLVFGEKFPFPDARMLLEERLSEEDTVPLSPKDALDYLLDAAIDRFGYAARDVFGAVFNYSVMTQRHENAFNLNYTDLQKAVSALARNQTACHSISHRILTLCPGPLVPLRWNIDFKSDWVARNVIQKLELDEAEDTVIRQQINIFRRIPEAQGLAGRLLEPLAHRYIANTTRGSWPLINMKSNDVDPPLFTVDRDSPVPDDVRFNKIKRKIVKFQSIADIYLENNTYYVPDDPIFPLFDAFTIELDLEKKKLAVLWVLQMTTSRRHGGSAMGYGKIREIIAILKDELEKDPPRKKSNKMARRQQATSTPLVQVRYLLVVPKDDPQFQKNLQWQFPKGWSQNRKKNDHGGNVYCLEFPLVVCSSIIKNVSSFERNAFSYSEWKCALSIVLDAFDSFHYRPYPSSLSSIYMSSR